MDPVRFDRLARRFAAGMGIGLTRRQAAGAALAGVAALAGAGRKAAAQESPYGGVALGGQCSSHVECVQTSWDGQVASVTCASNGLDWDGPLNCCLYDGGGCGDDAHCCAGLTCGAITTSQGYTRYVCQSAGGTYVNRRCWDDAECQAYDANTTCAGASYNYAGTCYGLQGAGCATADACYGQLQCVSGACTAVTAGTYRTALADLNMRAGSDATTYIVTLVPAGATVLVIDDYTENGYVYVRYAGYEGYVLANLLG